MRFRLVNCIVVSSVLLAVGCVPTEKKRRDPPKCLHGKNADGECIAPNLGNATCTDSYEIKDIGNSCVFYDNKNPSGCRVTGLSPRRRISGGCYVQDTSYQSCEMSGVDKSNRSCTSNKISTDPARVSIYLEVKEEGFAPHVVFDDGEKVQAGAQLTLAEQEYRGSELSTAKEDSKTILMMDLKIPWQLNYQREDGTEICAAGVLDGGNTSRDTAARGYLCI